MEVRGNALVARLASAVLVMLVVLVPLKHQMALALVRSFGRSLLEGASAPSVLASS